MSYREKECHAAHLRSQLSQYICRELSVAEIPKIQHYSIRFPKLLVPLDMHVIDTPASITVK